MTRQTHPRLRAFRHDESGSELVEFALSAGVLLTLLLGSLDAARAVYLHHSVAALAFQTSRYAMVRGASAGPSPCSGAASTDCVANPASIAAFAAAHASPGLDAANLQVTAAWPSTSAANASCTPQAPGCLVRIQVTYSFRFLFPFLPGGVIPLTASSAVTLSR